MKNLKAVSLGNAALKRFKVFILEFDNLSTLQTDQMIVVAPSRSRFIPGLPVCKFSLGCQAETDEELQGSVDGRITNFGVDFGHLGIDLSEVSVSGGVEEDVKDLLSLFRRLQAFPRDPRFKQFRLNRDVLFEIEIQFHFNRICPICQSVKKLLYLFMVSPNHSDLLAYDKIITHNDFDGMVSASLCAWALKVERIIFAGPLTIAKSQITITEKDIVCDLPYPLQCGLWFDHHEGNLQELEYRGIYPKSIHGRFDLKPSCSRVVYEYFSEQMELPNHFIQSVEEADIIDSFSYSSIEDWKKETPGKVIDLTLKTHFQSMEDQVAFMRNLVQQLRDRPIEEISHLPFAQKRLKQYREEEGRMPRIIQDSSFFLELDKLKEVIVIDLTQHNRRPHLIKNLAFLIYPEASAVLEIYNLLDQGVKSNNLGFSMSLSINANRQTQRKNIGEIMRILNVGDGHPGAAAGTIQCKSKQEMLKKKKEILNQIFKLWSTQ